MKNWKLATKTKDWNIYESLMKIIEKTKNLRYEPLKFSYIRIAYSISELAEETSIYAAKSFGTHEKKPSTEIVKPHIAKPKKWQWQFSVSVCSTKFSWEKPNFIQSIKGFHNASTLCLTAASKLGG